MNQIDFQLSSAIFSEITLSFQLPPTIFLFIILKGLNPVKIKMHSFQKKAYILLT